MQRSNALPVILIALIVGFSCCAVALCAAGFLAFSQLGSLNINSWLNSSTPGPTPVVNRPTILAVTPTPLPEATAVPNAQETADQPPIQATLKSPDDEAIYAGALNETLLTLEQEDVPVNNLLDLARRFQGKVDIPRTLEPPSGQAVLGEEREFWVSNTDTNANFQVTATLRYITDHLYFWIDNDVQYDPGDLRNLAEEFENKIYPTTREFFGSEWSPGVDGDEHLYILYAGGLGYSIAGYFSASDEFPPEVQEFSNGHEMFIINADTLSLWEEFAYGVLAHEFQHMIHWYRDRNETSWLNEGFSELAAFLNGYALGGFDYAYITNPDVQLNHWPGDEASTTPHYGSSFLFVNYLLDRFGEEAARALVADPENGLESVDNILREFAGEDPLTGKPVRVEDFFLDWVITNYLNDETIGDGRYAYPSYPDAPAPSDTEEISLCPVRNVTREVRQFGVDYIRISCSGETTLRFAGSTVTRLLPVDPYEGEFVFWSNVGDESDMTLTREFDFTGYSGPLTLSYWTWYDLEDDYDYVYVSASTDGDTWDILTTPSGTATDPSGNSFGWAYNGDSGGWILEEADLSDYTGQRVFLRFEYITDAAVNGEGFLVDEISIPEIGYRTGFETGEDGWVGEGFVKVRNLLPQGYRLALITFGNETTVEYIDLTPDNRAEIPLEIGGDVRSVVLVVTGTTRYTRLPTAYQYSIEE